MGWRGVHAALLAKDVEELAREVSPERNPNTPYDALRVAVGHLTPEECQAVYEWADRWLRNPDHDALRARGDRRWLVMSEVANLTASRVGAMLSAQQAGGRRVLTDAAERLSKALVRAAREHGLPNSFWFGELQLYGGPSPLLAAHAAMRYRDRLEEALRADGWKGARVHYAGRGTPLRIEVDG